jgi:hypothetical protein
LQREDHETSSLNFQRVVKNGGLGMMEGSAPSKAEKEASHGVRARYVGALSTPWVMAHHRKEEKKIKPLDDGDTLGFTGTLAMICSG